jgi:hypothetical protein
VPMVRGVHARAINVDADVGAGTRLFALSNQSFG